ncbi:MAG TPA: hypothetical protein VH762_00840 [Gemmatimonadaceae bacterium]|jgi:hypothetical protein
MEDYKPKGPLPPESDHKIELEAAVEFVKRYRKYAGPAAERGGYFWAEPIRRMLAEPGVVGMRYYHGTDADGKYRIILLGVDSDGRDIVKHPTSGGARSVTGGEGQVLESSSFQSGPAPDAQLENHWPCPPWCPPDGPFA